jgi:AraC family transcriptional regulator
MLRDGQPCDFGVEAAPSWSSAETAWGGFLLEGHVITGGASMPKGTTYFGHPLVLLYTGGQERLRYRIRGTTYECRLAPGVVRILYGEYELSSLSWSGPHTMFAVDIAGPGAPNVPAEDCKAWPGLGSHIATEDAQIAGLVRSMHAEVEAGCPAGRFFGECLSGTLAAYILGRYATGHRQELSGSRLSPAKTRQLLDYIDVNLDAELGLAELAATVGLSQHYFSAVFKNSFGVSPYQFVIRRRVERAKLLLATGRVPIAEIATMLGFSSQSHFTTAFRKATGYTPRSYRE